MKLEFLIPASPTPAFYSQVAMFRFALDRLGGDYRRARLVCVFGDETKRPLPVEWKPWLSRVEMHWVSVEDFRREGYLAQGYRRFGLVDDGADLSVICDADTLLVQPFDRKIKDLIRFEAIGGVVAHYHFPWSQGSGDPTADWNMIARRVLGHSIDLPFRYTLERSGANQCPFYINFGFLAGPPKVLRRAYVEMQSLRTEVRECLGNYFEAQVAFALAVSSLDVPVRALPMRYNFPNDPEADKLFAGQLRRAKLIHYLRETEFDRQKIFASESAFDAFLKLKLRGSNKVFQRAVARLTKGAYPFAQRPAGQPQRLRRVLPSVGLRRKG